MSVSLRPSISLRPSMKQENADLGGDPNLVALRSSLKDCKTYLTLDSRKSIEMSGQSKHYRQSIEFRNSLEQRNSLDRPRTSSVSAEAPPSFQPFDPLKLDKKDEGIELVPITPEQYKDEEDPHIQKPDLEDDMHARDDESPLKKFPISTGLTSQQASVLLKEYGRNELPEKVRPKWLIFLSQMWQPMPIMIWLSSIAEFVVQDWVGGALLIAINFINASLGFYETVKAGNAVAALKASLKPTTVCFRDGKWDHKFDARLLVPGDLVELASGAAVPADCMVNKGQIDVDESAMTGESLPATIHERELAKMGGSIVRGETEGTVIFTGKNTFFGKTASLISKTSGYSNLQILLIKIMLILSALSLTLCATAFIYLMATGEVWTEALSFAVIVLVSSIPMAIEIVTTTTLALGSRQMSRFGAIVSRLTAIEDLAGLNMLCSDKTGTLTKNKMVIQDDAPTYVPDITQFDLLKQAALAAKWESAPKDALDTLILRCHLWDPDIKKKTEEYAAANPKATAHDKDEFYNEEIRKKVIEELSDYEQLEYMPFDPKIKRTEATVKQKSTGAIFKVTKGAPHIIEALDEDTEKGHKINEKVAQLGEDGIRAMCIAVSEPLQGIWAGEGVALPPFKWHVTGLLSFLDPPRDDTKQTIAEAQKNLHVPVRMITGDHLLIAKKTCKDLEMGDMTRQEWPHVLGPSELPILDEKGEAPKNLVANYGNYIKSSDGFAQVFPEHKFLVVETYRQLGFKVGMTGDGVNDAPALKRADVGIAVAGATDAARAAADIILTEEGLSTIIDGIRISRTIFARMKSFLTYRIAATLQILFFFFVALFAFPPDQYLPSSADPPTFFRIPVIYLIIITIINDGTMISIGYDHAVSSHYPERWVLPILFLVASTLGFISCLSSLILLYFLVTSHTSGSLFQEIGIGAIEYGQIINAIFLKVAVSDILTLYSSRTAQQFFFQRRPHVLLFACTSIALIITTCLSLAWPCGELEEIPVCGLAYVPGQLLALWIWLYCIGVFIIQDIVKVIVWRLIIFFNLFNINNKVKEKKDTHEKTWLKNVGPDHHD